MLGVHARQQLSSVAPVACPRCAPDSTRRRTSQAPGAAMPIVHHPNEDVHGRDGDLAVPKRRF